jgi:PAS domain S-box-containing protein
VQAGPAAPQPITRIVEQLGASLDTLEHLSIPVTVLDRKGAIVWANEAARELLGAVIGKHFATVVTPGFLRAAQERFARHILGITKSTDQELEVRDQSGRTVRIDFSAVPLEDGHRVVGVLGAATRPRVADGPRAGSADVELTARQLEVLRHLHAGLSTSEMAQSMGLTTNTVRSHVRTLLTRLDVHSRLEAVIATRDRL